MNNLKEARLDLQVEAMFNDFEKQIEIDLSISNQVYNYFLNNRCKIYKLSDDHCVKIHFKSCNNIGIIGNEPNVEKSKIEIKYLIENFEHQFTKYIKIDPELKDYFNRNFLKKVSDHNSFVNINLLIVQNVITIRGRKEYVLPAFRQIRNVFYCLNMIRVKKIEVTSKNLTKKVTFKYKNTHLSPVYKYMTKDQRMRVRKMVKETRIIRTLRFTKTRSKAMRKRKQNPRNKYYDAYSLGKNELIINHAMNEIKSISTQKFIKLRTTQQSKLRLKKIKDLNSKSQLVLPTQNYLTVLRKINESAESFNRIIGLRKLNWNYKIPYDYILYQQKFNKKKKILPRSLFPESLLQIKQNGDNERNKLPILLPVQLSQLLPKRSFYKTYAQIVKLYSQSLNIQTISQSSSLTNTTKREAPRIKPKSKEKPKNMPKIPPVRIQTSKEKDNQNKKAKKNKKSAKNKVLVK